MKELLEIRIVKTEAEIAQCWEVASLLRPHLKKGNWVSMVTEMMQNEKYFITAMADQDRFVAFAGCRFMTSLHTGNIIYIDDLYTLDEYRGKGLATSLLDHVRETARLNDCDALVLDTDFTNNTAQKVYFKSGFKLAALHLESRLKQVV
ncbi:Acetyltransferase (GNAT) family protein [Dyadobacter sp. SG02]|uniref:GNAT family N-acetyltransferase n=1 Tax=Dyadobacter sp. SG02 TaxID=1855291 RepID=UPI0008CCC301|nr:GNAT family N-acetyltransferase [Dyadobacter sp. SG02]SEJ58819.1 Acetyltransferase (GNAT) family protein [Dyadobacter sp. SG02]